MKVTKNKNQEIFIGDHYVSVNTAGHSVSVSEDDSGNTVIDIYDCCTVTISGYAKRNPTITVDSDEYPANLIIKQTESKWLGVKWPNVRGPFIKKVKGNA